MKRLACLLMFSIACGACGDDGGSTVDARPDPCMPEMQFTGEYIDWDSTQAAFVGVFGAKFTLQSDPTKTTMTAPNGRFVMCIPAADGLVTIEPMSGSEYVAGSAVVNKMAVQTGAMLRLRTFKTSRAAAFGFDATKGHVFVNVDGGSRGIASSAAAGTMQVFDGTTWSQGSSGTDIYLGNIAGTSTTLTVSGGGAIGAGTVPLTPGAFTYVTIVAR